MGLSDAFLKDSLTQVISPKPISLVGKELVQRVLGGTLENDLFLMMTCLQLKGSREPIWFTPIPQWFENRIRSVYLDFAVRRNLIGPSFEEDMNLFCDAFSRGFKFSQ